MAFDEKTLTKGQTRKLNALRKSVGDELGTEVFGKWLAQQAEPKRDAIAVKIEEALAQYAGDRSFRLGNYGYTVRRARGKGQAGFVAVKNDKNAVRGRRRFSRAEIEEIGAILVSIRKGSRKIQLRLRCA